jgi:RHS repeat-associated protein
VKRIDQPIEITVRDGHFVHERADLERNWLHVHAPGDDWHIASIRTGPARDGEPEAALRCYLHDLEGSVALTVDDEAQELGREGYNVLGETAWGRVPGQPFRFHGAERDPLTGLYQLHGRPYAPWLGRFADDLSELPDLHAAPQQNLTAPPPKPPAEAFGEVFRVRISTISEATLEGADHGERVIPNPGPRHRPEPQGGAWPARRGVGQGADIR